MLRAQTCGVVALALFAVWAMGNAPRGNAEPASRSGRLWLTRVDGPGHGDDVVADIVVAPDGGKVFVTGEGIGRMGGSNVMTVAHDARSGAVLWSRQFDGLGHNLDRGASIAMTPDGALVFVAGLTTEADFSYDYITLAYQANTGAVAWLQRFDSGPSDSASSIALSPDGSNVFVTGSSEGTGSLDAVTVAYDSSTGSLLWTARLAGEMGSATYPHAMEVSPDGSKIFVTADQGVTFVGEDFITVAYDTGTGTALWVRSYNGRYNDTDEPQTMGVSPDGRSVFVAGWSEGPSSSDFVTLAYDAATGRRQWIARYDDSVGGSDQAESLGVSRDGSTVYVAGLTSRNETTEVMGVVAYDAGTGEVVWAGRYHGIEWTNSAAHSLAVDPTGDKVFASGFVSGGLREDADFGTVAFDATTGSVGWRDRYTGPGQQTDVIYASAASPDGTTLFVTGKSGGAGTGDDYVTIAYEA